MPNMPMATATRPISSLSSGMPKVKRSSPELTSAPTMLSSSPSTIMQNALSSEPWASATDATSPSRISEQ